MPPLLPYLTVVDAEAIIKLYQQAFGFRLHSEPAKNEQGQIIYCELEFHGAIIMLAPEGTHGFDLKAPKTLGIKSPLGLYIYCPDVDALYTQAVANGAISITAPEDAFWGDRYCMLCDPEGYLWTFGTLITKK